MKFFALGLCFLPSVILIICSLGSVRSQADRFSIACPGPYNCSCSRAKSLEFELLCPGQGEVSVLSATIIPDKYVHIECTYNTHFTDYALLKGLLVGKVSAVNFRLCPLPNTSLSELMKSIGVNSTNSLLFQSYRNLSNTLERKHLIGLEHLTRLLISSNGLTDLPEDLLHDMANLTWLDMRGNNVHLHRNFFQSVPKLQYLELGNNGLKVLEPGVFNNLTELRILNLWKNQLRNLTRGVFSQLKGLEQLDLTSNGLEVLPADVFLDLEKLVKLNLYTNNFTELPSNLFAGNPDLEVLRLYDNRQTLQLPPAFLSNLTKLKEVYLMKNNVSTIPEDIFWGSQAITNLSLNGNALQKIPYDLFRDQTKLLNLDLSYNNLLDLPDFVFRNLGNVEFLRLGYNRLQNISRNAFDGLQNLQLLDLEHNILKKINSDAFIHLKRLRHARLSHNQLSFAPPSDTEGLGGLSYVDYDRQSPFHHCTNLQYLYLVNNSVSEVFYDWRVVMTRLKVLDLSFNAVEHLTIHDVHFLSNELSVDLRHNNISIVNLQSAEMIALSQRDSPHQLSEQIKRNVRVLLEGNPLICDCRAYTLVQYLHTALDPEVYILVTVVAGNLTCHEPEQLRGIHPAAIDVRQLTCRLPSEEYCPPKCICSYRTADNGIIVNCSAQGLTSVPEKLPQANHKYVNHTELYLEHNLITSLSNKTHKEYDNVTHLFLSYNNISEIDPGFLPDRLEALTLDNNNLQQLQGEIMRSLGNSTRLKLLMLHNNPWMCDCGARDLLNLIQHKFKQIPWLSNVTCAKNQRPLSRLSVSDLCPVSLAIIISCVVIATCGVLIGSLAALYYRYQREVKVWLYSHHLCLWFVTEQELDKDKIYDAFVSYSHKDEQFVINTLVPGLEPHFKLCLHYRDWIAGEWIPNQIARSVEDSRRTLVVLSPNFLESVWGRMEFRAAHKQALSEGRARVIVVLYGDVGPTDDLDPELRAYISMNTYVKWGDPWFWRKLRYALPHPPDLIKGNILKQRSSRKEKKYLDDKLELIHTLDSPTTPPGATTPPAEAAVTTMETVGVIPNGKSITNGHAKQLA